MWENSAPGKLKHWIFSLPFRCFSLFWMFLFVKNCHFPLTFAECFTRLPLIQFEALSLNIKHYLTPMLISQPIIIFLRRKIVSISLIKKLDSLVCHVRKLMNFLTFFDHDSDSLLLRGISKFKTNIEW